MALSNKTEIPNMMLQPVIENCIRHGIKHLENKKGSITISLKQKTAYILCEITDNGQGRNIDSNNSKSSFAEQKSYGLDIVRKRLALLSETERGDFFIRIIDLKNADGSASGTRVILHVPFKLTNT